MSLNSRIKERREQLNLSRIELAKKIGVTPSAIANYENDISSPKVELLYKLFDALDCDANYLYQDEMRSLTYKDNATPEEFDAIIKKYRVLDEHGKKMVDFTLSEEHKRWETEQGNSSMAIPMIKETPDYLEVNAAHDNGATEEEKAAADRIMMDDSEWE